MSKGLFFNTRDRLYGTNDDATFDMSFIQLDNPYLLSLEAVEFPFMMYPISEARKNSSLYIQQSTEGFVREVAIGVDRTYTGDEFAQELETQLQAQVPSGTWTVTFNSVTGKLTIANDTQMFAVRDGEVSLHREAGFDVDVQTEYALTQVGFAPIDLSGTKFVDVYSNLSQTGSYSSTSGHPIARIQTDVPFGTVVYHQTTIEQLLNGAQAPSVRMSLRDDRNHPLGLPFNAYVSYTFKVAPPDPIA